MHIFTFLSLILLYYVILTQLQARKQQKYSLFRCVTNHILNFVQNVPNLNLIAFFYHFIMFLPFETSFLVFFKTIHFEPTLRHQYILNIYFSCQLFSLFQLRETHRRKILNYLPKRLTHTSFWLIASRLFHMNIDKNLQMFISFHSTSTFS